MMALLFADSFDHYGVSTTGRNNMINSGQYSEVSTFNARPSNARSRTGPSSLMITGYDGMFVKTLNAAHLNLGVAYGIYCEDLSNNTAGLMLRTTSNSAVGVYVATNGSLRINLGTSTTAPTGGTLLFQSEPGLITTGAWHHVEIHLVVDPVVGKVEVRVNGETLAAYSDINTGSVGVSSVRLGRWGTSVGGDFSVDDLVIWADDGNNPKSFIGPARVITTYPASDTPVAGFTKVGAATGYECINQPVQDGNTTYIEGEGIGDISEFGLGSLPPETEGIVGVFVPTLAKLSAAGTGGLKVSLVSGAEEAIGFSGPLTQAYAYRNSIFSINPATGGAWNKATLEAALLRFEKTA